MTEPIATSEQRRTTSAGFVEYWLLLIILNVATFTATAGALPEFAYRELNVEFVGTDGKPVSGASIYGFCRQLNLVWPRRDRDVLGRNDILWHQSFLGKTDKHGSAKVVVPPGEWGFFVLGKGAEGQGTVVAAWTDFKDRTVGTTIRIAPISTKHWTLHSAEDIACAPNRIFLKPEGFPIWIPIGLSATTKPLQMEISSGRFQLWAAGDATVERPGFALDWGTLNDQNPDGKLLAPKKSVVLECKGGQGNASLSWSRLRNFGLEGDLGLCNNAKVLLSPGMFTLTYRRPIAAGISGRFVGQFHTLPEGGSLSLNMETPLEAAVDQRITKSKSGRFSLVAQLYLVDGNGHLLEELTDASNKPVPLTASVTLNGKRFPAPPVLRKVETLETDDEESDEPTMDNVGGMWFVASVGSPSSDAGAIWDFTGPPGVLPQTRLTQSERVVVTSATFRTQVPRIVGRSAQNMLAQAEILAAVMKNVSNKKRKIEATKMILEPGRSGAAAGHDGAGITIGTLLLFYDAPMAGHTMVHELGHSFGFRHGGLHETIVEASRCAGGEQITAQPVKWNFLDRMNGVTPRAARILKYPNIGLYLYCYAQRGLNFVHFMSAHESGVLSKLSKQGFTTDELTAAMLTIALGRDMTPICSNYGLAVTADRVRQAVPAIRNSLQKK